MLRGDKRSNISTFLKNILSARYGKDVRQSIHDAIEEVDKVADTAQNSATQSAKQAQESAKTAKSAADRAEQVQASIPAEYDELSQNVDELNVKVDTIIDKAELNIKNTATGETIHLTDSADSKVVAFGLYGKAEQKQYSGKNELENTATNQTVKGVTFTVNEDKSVTVNGTPSENADFVVGAFNILPNEEYIMSGCPSGGSAYNYFMGFYGIGNDFGSGIKYSGSTEFETFPFIRIIAGQTVTNLKFYPMIRKASITDPTYEPFVGNAPSPSPDYPQDIEVAGASGSVEVKSVGKNLLKNTNTNQTKFGVTFTVNDGVITADGTATDNAIFNIELLTPLAKGNYILSGITGGSATTYFMDLYDKEWTNRVLLYNGEREINQGVVYVRMIIAKGYTANNVKFYPMIRLASDTDDTYEPHTETTSLISTPDGLAGINGVYDEVVKYADGSGKRIQRIAKEVFDGSDDEGWYMTTSRNKYRPTIAIPIKADNTIYDIANILCTHYQAKSSADTFEEIEGIASSLHSVIFIYDSNYNTGELSLWKARLAENPITVWYELAEPIITDLTAEEIAETEKLHTFYPVTNISNDAECGMAVTYLADSKNYIDNQLAIQAQAQEEALLNMLLLMPESVQASMIENDTNNLLNEAEV